ncbi:hypothetical protein J2Y45_004342 [Dyadobacter sp. BE34]|uniref:Peptidase S74 domain-containing protein n=1 Tax=Dyadobacter fermentans TaxID=94254 RepID=A0ABU1R333_9BACT|nr:MULTISPECIES: tail fiber domain-containing protein [Dyadobacter]MDR6807324.1 hypothetical protein [Dyadobacter fermentans]MDR7045065.1 hypothetical protein [Dyadobacter sp. BE242]MDR7199199.1 hypothetical protein [Dyadobacter sp. BE34]MDR7217159.1 hypothetical protein [Dyadobacter sp. BE31]MDR7265092.1 hypothetical protein [Dyadobacter sp. BE32]
MKQLAAHLSGYLKTATAPTPPSSKAFPRRPKVIFVILLSVSLLMLFKPQSANAQAPQQFSFQGVARGADGKAVSNATVSVRIKIHKDGPNGEVVFSETQIVETNSVGVFTLIIGGLIGGLDDINWGSDNCFIQTEIDLSGGANFTDLGTTQLKSVPYALASRQWVNNIPVMQTGVIGSGPTLPTPSVGANLIWYPKKAAFRVGSITLSPLWEDASIGLNSFATGKNSVALGENSFAAGHFSNAGGISSFAMGNAAYANGDFSFSAGRQSTALAQSSIALGESIYAKSVGSVALGMYNNISDPTGDPLPTDRIFQLGNGTSDANKSNAITVLRNGNVGIGNSILAPEYLLDIAGRMRIRNNGQTAGIQFNNSANNADGFVGMKTDDEIGFYVNNGWRFWVNGSNAYVNGALVSTSDRRLKKQITTLTGSLPLLIRLNGYHYYWKDLKLGTSLQTGLIAQQVEERFPELVTTNKDGYKAVNYIGLIPHLIEAVKELDKKTEEIATLKKELASVQEMNKKLSALEASVKELLAGKSATSTQTSK